MTLVSAAILPFFLETRADTEVLCAPLEIEDFVVQPVDFVSPPKWHLGHTTWFFEEFLLKPYKQDYQLFDDKFAFVFNSYYESVGARVVRTDRGNLSRPTVNQIYDYRKHVTQSMTELIQQVEGNGRFQDILEIGIHHEKQHQELLLTDIKYILGNNPLLPAYTEQFEENDIPSTSTEWITMEEGLYKIGHQGDGFCYDNETGRHQVFLQNFKIASAQVTNGEYLEFMESGGYDKVLLWHADGWEHINSNDIKAPLYWHSIDGNWHQFTLSGLKPLDLNAPLSHVSYYEAFAYAQFRNKRLPTEFEWEAAQSKFDWGNRWEWTESAYLPYPGYKKEDGALGEYNGKFMVNQKILRGGSVATSAKHTRATYRNFFQPHHRWQFTGIRLADY
ncbi:MAG: ergothioneine biosynthesis protein EgtB [Leeuwenhoekiella sp.]